jgi:hypothetical protein
MMARPPRSPPARTRVSPRRGRATALADPSAAALGREHRRCDWSMSRQCLPGTAHGPPDAMRRAAAGSAHCAGRPRTRLAPGLRLSSTMRALSSPDYRRRRPVPVITSVRHTFKRSGRSEQRRFKRTLKPMVKMIVHGLALRHAPSPAEMWGVNPLTFYPTLNHRGRRERPGLQAV